MKTNYDKLAAKVEEAAQEYETAMHDLEARHQQEREALIAEKSAKIEAAQKERDDFALSVKLKNYPKSLIEGHPACMVCNAPMRPFTVVKGETVVKLWACAAGNLANTHDLIELA